MYNYTVALSMYIFMKIKQISVMEAPRAMRYRFLNYFYRRFHFHLSLINRISRSQRVSMKNDEERLSCTRSANRINACIDINLFTRCYATQRDQRFIKNSVRGRFIDLITWKNQHLQFLSSNIKYDFDCIFFRT